jgi:hypothetical protein
MQLYWMSSRLTRQYAQCHRLWRATRIIRDRQCDGLRGAGGAYQLRSKRKIARVQSDCRHRCAHNRVDSRRRAGAEGWELPSQKEESRLKTCPELTST